MKAKYHSRKFVITILFLVIVSIFAWLLMPVIGYRAVGFIFLIGIVALGTLASPSQIFLAAFLSALIWNYFFIPPTLTFFIHAPDDIMMCITYLAVAVATGFLAQRIRQHEAAALKAKQLEESEKLHQAILNSISHELKTPLTTIIGSATALQDDKTIQDEEARSQLTLGIIEASSRLNRLIENLLDTSRLDSGAMKLNLDWHDISDLVSATLGRLQDLTKNHVLEVKIADRLPLVKLDFALMEHVLSNLILNAANYSEPGSRITLSVNQNENDLTIMVDDSGSGIPKEYEKMIFQKFYRIPGSPSGGTGLGLSIALAIVEAHGGKIWVEQRQPPARGSRFVLKLKLDEAKLDSSKPNPSEKLSDDWSHL